MLARDDLDAASLSTKVELAAKESDALSMDYEAQQEKLNSSVHALTLNIRLKEGVPAGLV